MRRIQLITRPSLVGAPVKEMDKLDEDFWKLRGAPYGPGFHASHRAGSRLGLRFQSLARRIFK